MSTSNFYINLSMLGTNPTGLGIYSEHCAEYLERFFASTLLTSHYHPRTDAKVSLSPRQIAIGAGRFAAIWRAVYSIWGAPKRADFIYSPTHHGFRGIENQVITILDLIAIHHPKQHKMQYLYFRYFLPSIVKKCRAIFTISETAKADICDFYSIKPEKVFIVPCGVDYKTFFPGLQDDEQLQEPYLLVVGASYPHKNIHEILLNWPLWKGKYKLKIASSRGKYKLYLQDLIEKCELENHVEFLGYVSTEELADLYRGCSALLFPSLWEGFGLPPIEVLASGRPAIVSDIPVHKEILGDAAIYVTPGNFESWRNAFGVLNDQQQINQQISRGLSLVQQYSWERVGQELVKSLLAVEPRLEKLKKPV
jgi:glycosyltransferase involved in cell wall biosynthesis